VRGGRLELSELPGHLIRRCQQISAALFLDECEGLGVTPIQFSIRSALVESPVYRPDRPRRAGRDRPQHHRRRDLPPRGARPAGAQRPGAQRRVPLVQRGGADD
jgi:hypothetical protein